MASLRGHQSLVQLFLDNGANPEARFRNEWTPLYLALVSNNEKVSRTISWHVPDIATHLIYSSKGLCPPHLASYLGLAPSVRFFLCKGIDINALDLLENTPLHHALASGDSQLGYSPKPYTVSQMQHLASHDEVLETVVALVEEGAGIEREKASPPGHPRRSHSTMKMSESEDYLDSSRSKQNKLRQEGQNLDQCTLVGLGCCQIKLLKNKGYVAAIHSTRDINSNALKYQGWLKEKQLFATVCLEMMLPAARTTQKTSRLQAWTIFHFSVEAIQEA